MAPQTLTHICLVEDDPDIQEITKLALEMVDGMRVEVCSSGAEALEKTTIDPPQLILLDVMMPNMDGPTTLLKLREISNTAHIPVIFLTAKIQAHEVENYKKLGALDVISKPFDPLQLAKSVLSIWNQHA